MHLQTALIRMVSSLERRILLAVVSCIPGNCSRVIRLRSPSWQGQGSFYYCCRVKMMFIHVLLRLALTKGLGTAEGLCLYYTG